MEISLSPKWSEFVQKQIKKKKYRNARDVVQKAFLALQASEEQLQWEKEAVSAGIAQADRGEMVPVTEELVAEIMSRGRARLSAKNRKSA